MADDTPDSPTHGLLDEIDRIVEEGSKAGKIPPALQVKIFEDLIAACGGNLDRAAVDRFRTRVESMPVLVTTTPTGPPQPDEEILRILAHDFDPGPPGKPPSADWDTWSHIAQCALWEAVVLSLGFEPIYFVPIPDGQGGLWIVPRRGQQLPIDAALRLLPQDDTRAIHRRLRIALSQPATVIKSTDHFLAPRNFESTISLPAFGTWAVGIWPDLPVEFPRNPSGMDSAALERATKSPAPDLPPATESKPLHPKERTTLLTIIGTLLERQEIDIAQPFKAAEIIEAAADKIGVSLGKTTLANILKEIPGAMAKRRR